MPICATDVSVAAGNRCRELDFNIKFEQCILSIIPNVLFIICLSTYLPSRLSRLRESPGSSLWNSSVLSRRWDWLMVTKTSVGGLLIALDCASLALLGRVDVLRPLRVTTEAAYSVQLISSLFLLLSSVVTHYLSIAPSTLNILFLLIRVLLGACQLRTFGLLDLQESDTAAFAVAVGSTAMGLAMIGVEMVEKRGLLRDKYQSLPRRSISSFVLKPFFFHLISLLRTGHKRKLDLADLSNIPPSILSESTIPCLTRHLATGNQSKKSYLFRASFRAFGAGFLKPFVPRTLLMLASFGQVFLVKDMTRYVGDLGIKESRGWGLVGGFVVIYTVIPVTTYLYWQYVYDFSTQFRGALAGAIYEKTLRLSARAAREVGQGAAATYMSVDMERVITMMPWMYETPISVFYIVFGIVLLWFQVRWAMFAALLVMALLLTATSTIINSMGRSQKAWLDAADRRIKVLSTVVKQLIPIKLGAFESVFLEKIEAIRNAEIDALVVLFLTIFSASVIANTAANWCTLACLGAYLLMQAQGVALDLGPLDASKIFTVVTIMYLLDAPLNAVGQMLPDTAAAVVSLNRIRDYLILEEKPDRGEGTEAVGTKEMKEIVATTAQSSNTSVEAAGLAEKDASSAGGEIYIDNATFSWETDVPVLTDISFKLVAGNFYMLIGPVGSGKTTLLLSMLGETMLLKGHLRTTEQKISFTSQTPFIFPGTIRFNIIYDKTFDEVLFSTVVDACGLVQDLATFPQGAESILGERGITLSGGQRQRVALARAVYSQADIVFLDDVFSALDGETERQVFNRLFGNEGLLKGKTVVLVTHFHHHLLSADQVVVMENGRIRANDTVEVIQRAGIIADVQAFSLTDLSRVKVTKASGDQERRTNDPVEDEEAGDRSTRSRLEAYTFLVRSVGIRSAIISICLFALMNAVIFGIQGYLKEFSTAQGRRGRWIGGYAALSAGWVLLQSIGVSHFTFYCVRPSSRISHRAEAWGVFHTTFDYLQVTPSGKIVNRFSQDIQQLDFAFPLAMVNVIFAGFGAIGGLVFLLIATPWLGVAMAILFPIFYYLVRFCLATSTQLQHLEAGAKSPLYTLFSTTLGGLHSIRSFNAQPFFMSQNQRLLNASQGPYFFRFETQTYLKTTLAWLMSSLSICMGVIAVLSRRSTNAALLGAGLSQIVIASQYLKYFLMAYSTVEHSLVSIKRIKEFVDLPNEETLPEGTSAVKDEKKWLQDGRIEFRDYSMKYKDDLPRALDGLSFQIAAGEKIGICGRTGSGKSSIMLALFRAIHQSLVSGAIYIDGVETATMTLQELRSSMCIVTQDPFLWRGSIRENVDVEGIHADDQIWSVLEATDMKDVVSELPNKLDEELADEESLSKGQRQLLCVARALLLKKKIVVLDEATSSMDHVTDERIRKVLETHMKDVTVLAVAHRISSIVNYDKVLLLDQGKLIEFDNPQTLLNQPDSRFARLAATQGIQSRTPSEAGEASSDEKDEKMSEGGGKEEGRA